MVNKKSIHFVLSKSKDADLLAWKKSLEDGSFNRTINEILIAECEKKIANIPCGSKKVEKPQTINSRLVVYDRYAIELIESFGTKEVTSSIKKIIRKHLTKNRQAVKPSKDDRYKLISKILNSFEVKMREKEQEYSGVSNKYQKLCDAYDIAIKNLFDKLLSCASAPTMNEACNKIRTLNYMDIINEAYKTAFEVPPTADGKKEQTAIPFSKETKPNPENEEKSNTVPVLVNRAERSSEESTNASSINHEENNTGPRDMKKIMQAIADSNAKLGKNAPPNTADTHEETTHKTVVNENTDNNEDAFIPHNSFLERMMNMSRQQSNPTGGVNNNGESLQGEEKKKNSVIYDYEEDEYYDEDWDE